MSSPDPEATMTDSHHIPRDLIIAAVGYVAFLASWFGALVLWSRRCTAHKPYAG
jgi:hypothetical protein